MNGGGSFAPYCTNGAFCSQYAFCSNLRGNSLWLGNQTTSLGCDTDGGFTISFWVKPTSSHSAWSDFFGFRIGGYNYRLEYTSASSAAVRVFCNMDENTSSLHSDYISAFSAGRWNHVALVFSGSSNYGIYVNGELATVARLAGGGTLTQVHVGQTLLREGTKVRCYPNNSSPTGTAIDNLDIYDTAFSAAQVATAANGHRREMPIWWKFDETNSRGLTAANSGSGDYTAFKWNPKNYGSGYSDYGMYLTPGFADTAHSFHLDASSGKFWANFCVTNLAETSGYGFSYSFWLKANDGATAWRSIFGFVLGDQNFRLAWGNATPRTLYYGGTGMTGQFSGFTPATWQHVCVLWNHATSKIEIYIDGEKKVATTFTADPGDSTAISRISVGPWAEGSNISEGFYNNNNKGTTVDEFAFFNYALSTNEIAWLGTRLPALPALESTNIVRSVSGSALWDGGVASWGVNEWDDGTSAWADSSRTVPWPLGEDSIVAAEVSFSEGAVLTNDTFVTSKRLVLAPASSATLPVSATLAAASGSLFAPHSLEIADGLVLTVPLYAVSTPGTLTLDTDSKIVFDVSNYCDGGTSNALSAGAFALPSGETSADLLSHFGTTDANYTLSLSADGKTILVAADSVPVVATWTGAGDGVTLDSAANWTCLNGAGTVIADALPGAHSRVVVCSGSAALSAAPGATFPWEYLRFESGSATLQGDCDWRGFGAVSVPDGVTVDLAGNNLYIGGGISGAGTIADTSATGGELHIYVAEGETAENSTVAFAGSLKLVKEGEGAFVSSRSQTYTGGTLVSAGTLQPHDATIQNSTGDYDGATTPAFGTGQITVSSGAAFDVRGNSQFGGKVVLAGGTLQNTGPYDITATGVTGTGATSLTADSYIYAPNSLVFESAAGCDLCGNTLNVDIATSKRLYLRSTTFTNGTIYARSGGWLTVPEKLPTDASTVDLKVASALEIFAALDVRDYEADYALNYNNGAYRIRVHGTFKPSEHDYFHGVRMLDGSTLDLSSRTNALPATAAFTTGANTLAFGEDGSETRETIYVKTGGAAFSRTTPLVTWDDDTRPDPSLVRFAAVDDTGFRYYSIKEDGLYAPLGFTLIVR